MYDLKIEPDTLFALFGCSVASLALPHTVQQTHMFGMLISKGIILHKYGLVCMFIYECFWIINNVNNNK